MNKQQEPRLRFQGFTGEWKTEGFESVGEFNPKAEIPQIFQYVDLESVVGTQLISYREEFKETAPSRAQRLAKNGDLFFQAVRPYQKNNYLFEKNNENFVFSTGYIQIRPQNDGYFLLTLVQKEEFVQEVLLRCTGTSYPAINTSSLQNIAILLPPTAEEQAHLGNFFRRLDSQIAESRTVLEKSRQLKKAMLAKMFPANGEKIPKIRFKGFDGEWECRKLRDLMNVTSVKRIHQSDWTNEGVRFLRARDIVAFNKGERIEEPLFISKEKYNEYSELSGKVKIGDLLVTGVGTIGVPYLIEDEDPLYFKDGNVIWFQNENKIGGLFFYYSFLNNFIQDFIIETAGIGTVGTYTIDTGKKTPIFLPPTKSEQTAIGLFFRQLDETIALQSAEIEKLNQLKKGLLAAMLV